MINLQANTFTKINQDLNPISLVKLNEILIKLDKISSDD